jgi:hypothetical protein
MTSHERDFDRLARAWLELGPNVAPDRPIAAALLAIDATPQVRRPWRWPTRRSPIMSRITILAVLAGTIAILVGALVLSGGNQNQPGPSDAPAVVDTTTSPTTSPSISPAILPAGVSGGWVAPSRGTTIENLTVGDQPALGGNPAVTTVVLVNDVAGPRFWLDRRGTPLLVSSVTQESADVLRFTMQTMGDPNCVGQDVGRYRWSETTDRQWLTLEPLEDACETRSQILAGTWQRSLAHDNSGGPGIAAGIEPYVTFTLPSSGYRGAGLGPVSSVIVDRADGQMTFKIWKDLDGFVDPCDRSKGRLAIEPGMDAFLAYLRDDPRFRVTSEDEFEIDGHRAVQVDFRLGEALSAPCWDFDGNPNDRTGVLTWVPEAESDPNFFWNGQIDSPGQLIVTEVDGATLAFEALTVDGDALTATRDILETVRFVDELPTPPPS